jgi:hypothetical protein
MQLKKNKTLAINYDRPRNFPKKVGKNDYLFAKLRNFISLHNEIICAL